MIDFTIQTQHALGSHAMKTPRKRKTKAQTQTLAISVVKEAPSIIVPVATEPPVRLPGKPTLSLYKNKLRNRLSILFGFGMALDAAFSLFYGAYATKEEMRPFIIVWALAPPIYFFVEYQLLFDNWEDPEKTAHLRHLQGLAEKIWAGVLFLLVLLYFK
jgi:hypothetical protein